MHGWTRFWVHGMNVHVETNYKSRHSEDEVEHGGICAVLNGVGLGVGSWEI